MALLVARLAAADPLLAWNLAIIEGTQAFACAYKPNIAFYEALGRRGYDLLEATLAAIPPETPVILDDSKLTKKLGTLHKTSYDDGIKQTLAWMRS